MEEKNGLISYLKREMKELLRKTLEMISCDRCDNVVPAVLYYISQHFICWDFVGMTIQDPKFVGMDPNSLRPKPRPSTFTFFVIQPMLRSKIWSGFGMETVGIHPNDFGVLNGNPNKIPTNEMLGGVV